MDDFEFQPKTLLFICGEEGVCREEYLDGGNTETWGFGLTKHSEYKVDEWRGKKAPIETCVIDFVETLKKLYLPRVFQALGKDIPLEVLTGALSFVWNTGGLPYATWAKLYKVGDMERAEASFLEWDRPSYIIERRKREAKLIFQHEWNIMNCTEWTRLTKSRHIDWRSGVHIDILPTISKVLQK